MRIIRGLAVTLLVAIVVVLGSSGGRAQGASTIFYGIGDLPEGTGGVGSAVRDATRVGGTIYAVGSSTTYATGTVPTLDTPALWTLLAGSASGTLTALPAGAPYSDPPGFVANAMTAYQITPSSADFIASQAKYLRPDGVIPTRWVRVDRNLLASADPRIANLDLSSAGTSGTAALAISDSGGVVFGQRTNSATATSPETRVPVRYEPGLGPNFPDLTPTGKTWGFPIPRGTSSNGLVMVGAASNGAVAQTTTGVVPNQVFSANAVAFRYEHNAGTLTGTTKLIPLLAGGTWNMPVALSGDETVVDQTVVIGNSTAFPNGEVYLTNAANAITATLGSPNTALMPRVLGGMTADGSVVAVTFAGNFGVGPIAGLGIPTGGKYAYIHNSHGWFHFASVLAAQNVDLVAMGWDPVNVAITGVRTVEGMDLVFGQGRRRTVGASGYVDGAVEGFVAELPAGVLAAFNPTPTPPSDQSIVGAWAIGTDSANPTSVRAFLADGTFVAIQAEGFERGLYTWAGNAVGGAFTLTTLYDTNGTLPPSGANGSLSRTLIVAGDTFTLTDTNCGTCTLATGTRITGGAGSIVGGWVHGNPAQPDNAFALVLLGSSAGYKYFTANDDPQFGADGVDLGTYTWDSATGQLDVTPTGGTPDVGNIATLTRDELGLHILDDNGVDAFDLTRIVAPSTVVPVITNATLEAGGAEDTAFSYTVTATNALTFDATGLPGGVTIDSTTGVISGTPTVNGTFNVTITVTNTFGDTDSDTLVLTFAAPPAGFHGIGDLAGGGVGSAVRDATRVSGTIYAVGASTVNATATLPAVPNVDTPALWTWTGIGGTLEALPNTAVFVNTLTAARSAYAITPDGAYLASQAPPNNLGGTNWVRVTRSLLPNMTANLNLSSAPGTPAFAALAISDSGGAIYGLQQLNGGLATETRTPRRYELGVGFNFPDLTPTGKTWGFPIPRGTSADGLVMVGAAANGQVAVTFAPGGPLGGVLGTNAVAFRYVHNAGTLTGTTTLIPTLPAGGSWNMPVALSATGDQTVVIGNSTAFPNGEVYLTNAANTITATLGSPNTGMMPRALGGMTADGSVVAVTFSGSGAFGSSQIGGLGIPSTNKYAYIHNSHGWFHFGSVLAAQGVDLVAMGWDVTNVAITGVRTVEGVDLVFGQGRRRTVGGAGYVDGAVEGFVAELPAGVLAAFNPTPTPPIDQSIVGAWALGADPANPTGVITYLANGSFVYIDSTGFERGLYSWAGNAAGGAFTMTTLYDTNGSGGRSGFNGRSGLSIAVAGDTHTLSDSNCATCSPGTATRIMGGVGSIVGGWVQGNPAQPDSAFVAVLLGSNAGYKYFFASDDPEFGGDDFETGTYTWDPVTHELIATRTGGVPDQPDTATLTRDELGLHVLDDDGVSFFDFTRVVDPALVEPAFTGTLAVDGTVGFAFSFTPATNYAGSFGASGLPGGLVINTATGEISGTPTAAGSYPVLLTAGNSFGGSTDAVLTIAVSAPAIVFVPPGNDVTVEPEVPAGTPEVTLTFDNVGLGGGETTVAVIDPETTPDLAPEPPGNFEIVLTDGGVPLYYDISTTAPITGPITICFSYAGVDFGGQTPRLFHYENGMWVDITTSVNEATQTLCGETTSFSPFAIFKSTAAYVSATGFYAPISPLAGFVNSAKAGSTIPLKFNATVNGAEKTDTTGLFFSITQVAASVCSFSPQDQVDYVTIGDTNLRYDAQAKQFIQNWKLPRTAGCVIARITYKDADQEVLLLTAKFSLE